MRVRSLLVAVLAAPVAVLAAGSVAQATPTPTPGGCQVVRHIVGAGDTTMKDGATAVLTADGVRLTTPKQASQVTFTSPAKVLMKDVTGLSWRTFKHTAASPAALPAARVEVDVDNDGSIDTTLYAEPYYLMGSGNPAVGQWRNWDAIPGKWWASKTVPGVTSVPGGSYADNVTWKAISQANPQARVLSVGFSMGTYNDGADATVSSLTFATREVCKTQEWYDAKTRPGAVFSPNCDGSTVVEVGNPTDKGVAFAVDRLGDDLRPAVIRVDKGQKGVHTMPAGTGPISVWVYTKSKTVEIKMLGASAWDRGGWAWVSDYTWSKPASCDAPGGGNVDEDPTPAPGAGAGGGSGSLPITGAEVTLYAVGGLATLAIGAVLFLGARRRRTVRFTA